MKLTEKILDEMIKKELKEFSATGGGGAALGRQRKKASTTATAKSTVKTKKSTYDTAKSDTKTKLATKNTKTTAYNTKNTELGSIKRFRQRQRDGSYTYHDSLPLRNGSINPTWTSKNNEKNAASLEKRTAERDYDTAVSDEATKKSAWETAVTDMSDAEKAEAAEKAATNFGFGAGGGTTGGTTGGGTAKKGKKKKQESLFRILGRDLVNEIKDIKKYTK